MRKLDQLQGKVHICKGFNVFQRQFILAVFKIHQKCASYSTSCPWQGLLCLRTLHTEMFAVTLIFYHGNLMSLVKTYTLAPAYRAREEEASSACRSLSWNRSIFQILYQSISTETVAWGLQTNTCAVSGYRNFAASPQCLPLSHGNAKFPSLKLDFGLSTSRNFTNSPGRRRNKIMNLEEKVSSASR